MLDMGPYYLTAIVAIVGPVRRVAGFASTRAIERTIATGPRAGERFAVTTPTHVSAALELEGGVTASLVTSFDAIDRYVCDLEIHGTEGTLALPDPNAFEGPLRIRIGRGDWQDAPFGSRGAADARGLGLHDLVEAIAEDRPHRASGQLALHVVDVARSILRAAEERRVIEIESQVEKPQSLPVEPGSAVPRA